MRLNVLLSSIFLVSMLFLISCQEEILKGNYKDDYSTLYNFLEENENYSLFRQIVDAAIIEGTEQSLKDIYSAFNHNSPEGTNRGYTLFLPDNAAVEAYLNENNTTLDALLSKSNDCWNLATHHLLVRKILKKNFVNGAIGDSSLNGAFHVIRFLEMGGTVGYLIDESATVKSANIEKSNGVIHLIDKVLLPITYTSCEWLEQATEYSIFVEALKLTGLYDTLQAIDTRINPFTMFVESDAVFTQKDIYSLDDLKQHVSPNNLDYSNPDNPLYQFVGYHVLPERLSFSNLTQTSSSTSEGTTELSRITKRNYNTLAYYPLQVTLDETLSLRDGLLEQVGINTAFAIYDTIYEADTVGYVAVPVDHISIYEDISNMPTISGVVHFINYVMEVDSSIKPVTSTYQFREDPIINSYYQNISNRSYFLYQEDLERFVFEGDVNYIRYFWTEESIGANSNDYISFAGGSFTLSYLTTALMQGNYTLRFKLKVDDSYGLFDVYVDGVKVGNTVNLASKSPNSTGYSTFDQGNVFLGGYREHTISFKSVTPCRIYMDYIQFRPF